MDFNHGWINNMGFDSNENNFFDKNYAPMGSIFHSNCPYNMDDIERMFDLAVQQQDAATLISLLNQGYLVKLVEEGEFQQCKLFMAMTSALNQVDNLGNTALIYAAKNNSYVILDMLIKAGANVNIANPHGLTPLECAVREGHKYASFRLLSEMSLEQIKAIENNPVYAKMVATFKQKVLKKQELMFTLLSASLPLNSMYPAPCASLDMNIKKFILSQVKYPSWYAHRAEYDIELMLNKIRLIVNGEESILAPMREPLIFSSAYQPDEINPAVTEQKSEPQKKERCILL